VEAENKDQHDLIIPVYLDPNALLDVFASLEGGFSTAEDVRISDTTTRTSKRSISGEIGARIPALLKLGGGAQAQTGQESESAVERSLTRYNTYGSLLHKLRELLFQKGLAKPLLLNNPTNWSEILPLDFVEIEGIFQPVPLIEAIVSIDQLMDVILPAMELTKRDNVQKFDTVAEARKNELEQKLREAKGQDKNKLRQDLQNFNKELKELREQLINKTDEEIENIKNIVTVLNKIGENIEQGGVRTFLVDIDGHGRALVPFLKEYSRDGSMNELTYKKFRLLGKVVRNVFEENEKIDLLQGSSLRLLGDAALDPIFTGLSNLGQPEKTDENVDLSTDVRPLLKMPEVRRYVNAPVLEVFPIAVYI
jgi:hypothetical protein